MPRLIYGTAWKKERTTDLVVQAILAGFRGIDTACQPKHYSEALVGDALVMFGKQTQYSARELVRPNQVHFLFWCAFDGLLHFKVPN